MGIKCHGFCDGWKVPQPKFMPFLTHTHCRTCELWVDKSTWKAPRCKCCGGVLAILPRLNELKRKYRMYYEEEKRLNRIDTTSD